MNINQEILNPSETPKKSIINRYPGEWTQVQHPKWKKP